MVGKGEFQPGESFYTCAYIGRCILQETKSYAESKEVGKEFKRSLVSFAVARLSNLGSIKKRVDYCDIEEMLHMYYNSRN